MAKDIKLTIPVLNNIAVRIAEQTLKNNITDEATIRKIAGVTVKRLMSESMEHGDDVPGDFWEFIQEFWNEIDSTEDPAEQAGYYAEWLFGKTSAVDQVVEDLQNGVSEEELEADLAGEPDDFGIVGFAHDIMRVYHWFQECHDADVRRGVVPGDNAGEVKEEGAPVGTEDDIQSRISKANEEIRQLPWTEGIASVIDKYFPDFQPYSMEQRDHMAEFVDNGYQPIGETEGGSLVCNMRTREISYSTTSMANIPA